MNENEWNTLIADFETHLRAEKGLADLTIRNYKADIQPLYDYMCLKDIADMRALDRINLRGYLAWLTELGYVRHSVSRKLSTLRTFLKWMSRKGIIDGDPLPKRGMMKVEKRLPRFLSQEQDWQADGRARYRQANRLARPSLAGSHIRRGLARQRGEQLARKRPEPVHPRDARYRQGFQRARRAAGRIREERAGRLSA